MKQILSVLFFLVATQLYAADYYWVGGGGNWSDLNHWRLNSTGGPIPSIVPSSSDNVFFNANSGFGTTTATRTLTLDANGFCNNMSWVGTPNNPIFTANAGFTVDVKGNVSLSPAVTYHVLFSLTGPAPATLTANGNVTGNFSMTINKPGSSLTVTDNLVISGTSFITLTAGTLDISGKTVSGFVFGSENNNVRTLEMTNATVTFGYQYVVTGSNKTINAAGSTLNALGYLKVDGSVYHHANSNAVDAGNFYILGCTFSTLTFNSPSAASEARIASGNTIDTLIFKGSGSIDNNNIIDVLQFGSAGRIGTNNSIGQMTIGANGNIGTGNTIGSLRNGGAFTVSGGTNTVDSLLLTPNRPAVFRGTFNIHKYLHLAGQPCEAFTEVSGDSVAGSINFAAGAVVDFNNVILTGVKAFGAVTPIAVTGVDNGGNAGFSITAPTNLGTTLYWVGGPGDWNDRSHWSASSGGAGGACVPYVNDHVVFDGNSGLATGIVTTSSSSFCKDMTWNGVGTVTFNESSAYRFKLYGSLIMDNSVTMNADLEMTADVDAGITTNGSTQGTLRFLINKSGGAVVTLADNWSNPAAGAILLNSGGLNLAGRTISIFQMVSTSGAARDLDISNAMITVANSWDYRGAGKTISSSASRITSNGYFISDGLTYPSVDLTYTGATGVFTISGTRFGRLTFTSASTTSVATVGGGNTFGRLEFKGKGAILGSNTLDSLILAGSRNYTFAGTNIVNKYFQAQATPCSGLTEIRGYNNGVTTLAFGSGAATAVGNVYLQNVAATGPITPIAFNGADAGGNSGWTITTAAGSARYWIGGSGSWNDSAHWSMTSGGAGGACIPTVYDDVYFDAGSGFTPSGRTVSVDQGNAYCRNIDWTGAGNSPIWSKAANWTIESWGDSITTISAATFNVAPLTLKGSNDTYWTGAAPSGNFDLYMDKPGGNFTLLNDYNNSASDFQLIAGTFNARKRTLNVASIDNLNLANAVSIDVDSANITAALWRFSNVETAHVLHSANSTITATTFIATGLTYNKVNVSGTASNSAVPNGTTIDSLIFNNPATASAVGISGSNNNLNYVEYKGSGGIYGSTNTIDTLVFFPGNKYVLAGNSTNTITGEWYGSGTPCRLTEIVSSNAANATIRKASGDVMFDYVRLQRITGAGGAAYSTKEHSIDLGGNSNWTMAPYDGAAPIYGLGPDTALFATQFPYILRTTGFFGAPSSKYTWSDNSTADSLVVVQEGTYSVNVNFVDGCNISDTIVITKKPPLPVTLVAFDARRENGTALLTWSTTEETNSDRFEIERSADAASWVAIGTVRSHGESTTMRKYQFADVSPLAGQNLYRLKMIDTDGSFAYSRVRSLSWEGAAQVVVYPNPAVDRVYFDARPGRTVKMVSVCNLAGTELYKSMGKKHYVDLHLVADGMYILKITYAEGSSEVSNFVRGK